MSKVQGARGGVQMPEQSIARKQNVTARSESSRENVYRSNNDSPGEKFNSREGIERGNRGRGHAYGHDHAHVRDHQNKHKGDSVTVTLAGVGDVVGTVIDETEDTLIVVVDGERHEIDKKTGKTRGRRQASNEEMQQAQQMQQTQENQRREEVKAQEQRSEVVRENIKISNRKYDARLVERKKEIRLDEAEAVERGTTKRIKLDFVRQDQNKSVKTQFQMHSPENLHATLSVPEIILAKEQETESKKR